MRIPELSQPPARRPCQGSDNCNSRSSRDHHDSNNRVTDLTPAEAKKILEREIHLVIVDVPPYYANGHLPGAISIPLATLDAKIPTLDKTKTYCVYCHGDAPSIL